MDGYAKSQGFFFRSLDGLAKHFKVIATDQLGWGRSSRPDFTCESTEEIVACSIDYFEEWRKAINLSNFALLGHDFGGYVASTYALKYPEHVKHLILVGPAGFASESKQPMKLKAWTAALLIDLRITPNMIIRCSGSIGPEVIRNLINNEYGKKFNWWRNRNLDYLQDSIARYVISSLH